MELIWFCLAAHGLTQILVYGKIFQKYRPTKGQFMGWGEVFHCPMCMGFWVGLFLFSINGFTELFTFDYNIVNMLICGCVSSGTSYILSVMFEDSGFNLNLGERNE